MSNVCLWIFSRKDCHMSCTVACGGTLSAWPTGGWFEVEKCNTQMQLFASWRRILANFPTFGGFRHVSSLMWSPRRLRSGADSRSKAAPWKPDFLTVLLRKRSVWSFFFSFFQCVKPKQGEINKHGLAHNQFTLHRHELSVIILAHGLEEHPSHHGPYC